jgi:hypothetical protein
MARDVARKLHLTAAVLGTVARKDLAAAFRRVNANTSFDIARADKWLQGRAQPRELQVYEDWSKVLDLNRPGQWIADCDTEAFLDEICSRHDMDRKALLHSVETMGHRNNGPGRASQLAGTFVCYSHAWSPYFAERLIRAELSIGAVSSRSRLPATYTEVLPTGPMELKGTLAIDKRSTIHLEVGDILGGVPLLTFRLFPASPPASILAGLMFGTTVIGPDAQPSVTRIIMVRLPVAAPWLRSAAAYLPPHGSIAAELATLGLRVENSATLDQHLTEFLSGGIGGFDQVPVSPYRTLTDLFDRAWFSARS